MDDPKKNAPEVPSYDAWEDPLAEHSSDLPEGAADPVVLPLPRAKNEFPALRNHALSHPEAGFHITPLSHNPDNSEDDLDVQKLEGHVVRLENTVFSPAKNIRPAATFTPTPEAIPESSPLHPLHEEEHKWGRATKRSIRWIITGGLGVAVLVVFALIMLPIINESNAARPGLSQIGLVIDSAENIGKIENLNEWIPRRPEAMLLFRFFATAQTVDQILPVIRDSEQLQELIRKNRPQPAAPPSWSPPSSSTWMAFEVGNRISGVLEGNLPDYSKFRAYMVASGNDLVLDWKATTGYSSTSFDELASGKGDPQEIRALISPSGYYNHIFTEADYQSYQLISPDESLFIWCYARRGEAAHTELEKLFFEGAILKSEKLAYRVTVRLARGPKDTLPNQWVLDELLHHEWVKP